LKQAATKLYSYSIILIPNNLNIICLTVSKDKSYFYLINEKTLIEFPSVQKIATFDFSELMKTLMKGADYPATSPGRGRCGR
jgi:hypothetical protein